MWVLVHNNNFNKLTHIIELEQEVVKDTYIQDGMRSTDGILAKKSVPANIIYVRFMMSWLPQVVRTSFTRGFDPNLPIYLITNSREVKHWSLLFEPSSSKA
ncbi:hypothetical protein TorRG33x02_126650 [Trema orientale]|uniref:Uncharacterized protein n=1 Tax=Trema orientale TaxID=63057 RepID=A0A2P5F1F8_TREOI|nr:hypothetical protein TorRG33x02_126650 [Trema orientale]